MIWILLGAMALAALVALTRIVIKSDPRRARRSVQVASALCWALGLALALTGKPIPGLILMALGAFGTGALARRAPSRVGERERRGGAAGGGPDFQGHANAWGRERDVRGRRSGVMTEEEAYQVLGLQPGASAEEVARAHRTLMKKVHPDQGGSTELAARVNAAKDVLAARRHA